MADVSRLKSRVWENASAKRQAYSRKSGAFQHQKATPLYITISQSGRDEWEGIARFKSMEFSNSSLCQELEVSLTLTLNLLT